MSAFGGKADIAQALYAFMLIMVISAGAGPANASREFSTALDVGGAAIMNSCQPSST